MSRHRNTTALLGLCAALLCALPWLAQPGEQLPQQSDEALEAQAEDALYEADDHQDGCAMCNPGEQQ